MTRYLTAIGLLVAVVTLTALSTSTAGAEETLQGYFISEVDDEETASVDGEQIGAHTFAIGSLPVATCASVKLNGEATTPGPAPTQVSISPEYEACHVIAPLLGTRTITVTMNGCTYQVEATGTLTESGQDLLGDFDIACPEGKKIEIHVYNTSSSNDTGASTLCTFDIEAQSGLSGITFEDKYNEVTDDVVADLDVEGIEVTRTTGSEVFCGPASQTAVYEGEATMRGTNEASEYVSAEVGAKKYFSFGAAGSTVKGENGTAKIMTEAGLIECTNVKYDGKPAAVDLPDDLTLTPTYKDCKFDGLTANFEFNECVYTQTLYSGFSRTFKDGKFVHRHTTGPMEISCKEKPITIKVVNGGGGTECTFTFASQAPEGWVDLTNNTPGGGAKKTIIFTHTLTKLAYEVKGDEKTCGKNGVKLTDGKLDGVLEVKAYSGGNQVNWQVVGLDAPKNCPE